MKNKLNDALWSLSCLIFGTYKCSNCGQQKPNSLLRVLDRKLECVKFHEDMVTPHGRKYRHCHICAERTRSWDDRLTVTNDRTDRAITLPDDVISTERLSGDNLAAANHINSSGGVRRWARDFQNGIDEWKEKKNK